MLEKTGHFPDSAGYSGKLLAFWSVMFAVAASLTLISAGIVTGRPGIIASILVCNLAVPGMPLAVFAITRQTKADFRAALVPVVLSSTFSVDLFMAVTSLGSEEFRKGLIILSLAVASILAASTVAYMVLVRPEQRRGRTYLEEMSRQYSGRLSEAVGKKLVACASRRKNYLRPVRSFPVDGGLVLVIQEDLLELLDGDEKWALILHEAGHHTHEYAYTKRSLAFLLLYGAYAAVFTYFGNPALPSIVSTPALLFAVISVVFLLRYLLKQMQKAEIEADSFCIDRMHETLPLKGLLGKLDSFVKNSELQPGSIERVRGEIEERLSMIHG